VLVGSGCSVLWQQLYRSYTHHMYDVCTMFVCQDPVCMQKCDLKMQASSLKKSDINVLMNDIHMLLDHKL